MKILFRLIFVAMAAIIVIGYHAYCVVQAVESARIETKYDTITVIYNCHQRYYHVIVRRDGELACVQKSYFL